MKGSGFVIGFIDCQHAQLLPPYENLTFMGVTLCSVVEAQCKKITFRYLVKCGRWAQLM
jgi:hypothetical protein